MSAPAPVTGLIKERHHDMGSQHHFRDSLGRIWIVSFFFGARNLRGRTKLDAMRCQCYEHGKVPMEDLPSVEFSGIDLYQKKATEYGIWCSNILLAERSLPAMFDFLNSAYTAPEMFEFLMDELRSLELNQRSHLSNLAGLAKFVNEIATRLPEKISTHFQVIKPECFSEFEKTFPPTFDWVRVFCEERFRQTIARGDTLADSLNGFASHCKDKIKQEVNGSEKVKFMNLATCITSASGDERCAFELFKCKRMQKVLDQETDKFLANSEMVVNEWLATLV
jgi:hypothetical protein